MSRGNKDHNLCSWFYVPRQFCNDYKTMVFNGLSLDTKMRLNLGLGRYIPGHSWIGCIPTLGTAWHPGTLNFKNYCSFSNRPRTILVPCQPTPNQDGLLQYKDLTLAFDHVKKKRSIYEPLTLDFLWCILPPNSVHVFSLLAVEPSYGIYNTL